MASRVKRNYFRVIDNSKPGSPPYIVRQSYNKAFCAQHELFKFVVWASVKNGAILGKGSSAIAAWKDALSNI